MHRAIIAVGLTLLLMLTVRPSDAQGTVAGSGPVIAFSPSPPLKTPPPEPSPPQAITTKSPPAPKSKPPPSPPPKAIPQSPVAKHTPAPAPKLRPIPSPPVARPRPSLQLPPPIPSPPSRGGNGIRLIKASGSRGRVLVSLQTGWLTSNWQESVSIWRPVCNDGSFTDGIAKFMCKLMGYPNGRMYSTPDTSFRVPDANASYLDIPIGYINCYPINHRRLLAAADSNSNQDSNVLRWQAGAQARDDMRSRGGSHGGSRRRQLLYGGVLSIPESTGYECSFLEGSCEYTGPLAGVECSESPLPPAPPPPPAPPGLSRTSGAYGVRLVGGTRSRGRLLVSSDAYWLTGGRNGVVVWRPVCDDESFTDDLAQLMCKIMGYHSGKKYFSPEIAFQEANTTSKDEPIGAVSCKSASNVDGGAQRRRLSQRLGYANIHVSTGYNCSFQPGNCNYSGPLVGVECSYSSPPPPPPPSPPSPPLPPRPPPAPPPKTDLIRMIGGAYSRASVEANLCESSEGLCRYYGRMEVLVPSPGHPGSLIWAPLCAGAYDLSFPLGIVACRQVLNYPDRYPYSYWEASANIPETQYLIPPGPSASKPDPSVFNTAQYSAWATVVAAGNWENATRVQDLNLQVSTTPCSNGALFTASCVISMS